MFKGIDLSSDTATKPTPAMKQAMFNAELGDEQKGEDPTTLQLEKMGAELLGLDKALFLPSATMANEIAIRLLCDAGDELIGAENCHLFTSETGGIAIHASVIAKPIPTQTGIFTSDDLRRAYTWRKSPHSPVSKCVSVENTTNFGGGLTWDLTSLDNVLATANELHLNPFRRRTVI
jgi:threonine aldolase